MWQFSKADREGIFFHRAAFLAAGSWTPFPTGLGCQYLGIMLFFPPPTTPTLVKSIFKPFFALAQSGRNEV